MAIQAIPIESKTFWVNSIRQSFRKGVESILETGRLLLEAKQALAHGEFEGMIEQDLPFGERTAEMLHTKREFPNCFEVHKTFAEGQTIARTLAISESTE